MECCQLTPMSGKFLSLISMPKNRFIFARIFYLTRCCSDYSINKFKATYRYVGWCDAISVKKKRKCCYYRLVLFICLYEKKTKRIFFFLLIELSSRRKKEFIQQQEFQRRNSTNTVDYSFQIFKIGFAVYSIFLLSVV